MKSRLIIIAGLLACISTILLTACSSEGEEYDARLQAYTSDECETIAGSDLVSEMVITNMQFDLVQLRTVSELFHYASDVIRGEVVDYRVESVNFMHSREAVAARLAREMGRELSEFTEEEMLAWFPHYLGDGEWLPEPEPLYHTATINRVMILEVFQGDYQIGDIIEVRRVGGSYGTSMMFVHDGISLEVGDDVVLFLYSWRYIGLPHVFLTPSQGAYFFPAADGRSGRLSLDTELESVNENRGTNVRVTIDDLLQLSDSSDFTVTRSGEWQPTFPPPTERQERIPCPDRASWDLEYAMKAQELELAMIAEGAIPTPSLHDPNLTPFHIPQESDTFHAYPTPTPSTHY